MLAPPRGVLEYVPPERRNGPPLRCPAEREGAAAETGDQKA